MSTIPGSIGPILGKPGVSAVTSAGFGFISVDGKLSYKPGAGTIDGTRTRDLGNTPSTLTIRPGKILAKNASSGKYTNWEVADLNSAYNGTGTSLTLSAAEVTELNRLIGATGSFVLTGPPTSGGTVRQLTASYSGASGTTVTITALGVAKVERIRFGTAATGGNLQLTFANTAGALVTTGNAAWSATDATFLANINSALDAAGTAGAVVATAISAVDTDFGVELTYAAASYPAGPAFAAQVAVLPTGATAPVYTVTTAAVDGRFVAGSVISGVNWSTPVTVVPGTVPVMIPDSGADVESMIPDSGRLISANLLPYPSDTALRLWIMQQMSTLQGNKFSFDTMN